MPAARKRRGRPSARGGRPLAGTNAGAEFALLARIRTAVEGIRSRRDHGVLVGIGDDCAVVSPPARGRSLVLTTDTMVEGVHFRRAWLTPRELGVRAFRAAVSDIAAMGARPRHVLLSLELPGDSGEFGAREAVALARAVAADAARAGASLVGGNVSGASAVAVTVTVIGEATKPLLRSGARAGDLVFVTGRLGAAAAGVKALLGQDKAARRSAAAVGSVRALSSAWRRPPVRLAFAAALAAQKLAHAMIDVSDGLLQDLGHIAAESRLAIRIDAEAIPVQRSATLGLALGGGEDYELAFTASPRSRGRIEALASRHRTPVRVIGVIDEGAPAVADTNGLPFAELAGYEHLASRASRRYPRT